MAINGQKWLFLSDFFALFYKMKHWILIKLGINVELIGIYLLAKVITIQKFFLSNFGVKVIKKLPFLGHFQGFLVSRQSLLTFEGT